MVGLIIGKCSNNSGLRLLLTPALLNDTVNVTIIPCPDVVTDQSPQMTDHMGVEGALWQGPLLGRGGCNPLQIQSGNRITEEDDICTPKITSSFDVMQCNKLRRNLD